MKANFFAFSSLLPALFQVLSGGNWNTAWTTISAHRRALSKALFNTLSG